MIESDFLELLDEAQRSCGKHAVDLAAFLGARLPTDDGEARAAAVEAIFRYTGHRPTLAAPDVKQSGQVDELSKSSISMDTPRLDAEGREIGTCTVCGLPLRVGEWGCITRIVAHAPSVQTDPFAAYFDYGLGKEITSLGDRWAAMKGTSDEDYGRDAHGHERPGVKGTPRLEYRDHPKKGELSARRDKFEQQQQERRRGHRP